jgi:nicotinamide-nucleotide amidase
MSPTPITTARQPNHNSRETSFFSKQIALLATGDEICNGDIVNSNSAEIAQRLFSEGMYSGTHITVGDNLSDIETAIHFLLQKHQALIITGGLGPTSDDVTRQALSQALKKKLVFDAAVWETIVARLTYLGYTNPPESNRQQAFFPENAVIIPNAHGTAAGCMVQVQSNGQFIFMLPGPPAECLPMFNAAVLPVLKEQEFQQVLYHDRWLLSGVNEAEIAEKLDEAISPFNCMTGYRVCYPYIEVKLCSTHQSDFANAILVVEKIVAAYKNR